MPFRTYVTATSSSSGVGTTKTQVNGATDLIIPGAVTSIHDMIPYQAPIANATADEGSAQKIELESQDIQPNISPKAYVMPASNGGKGTFIELSIPALRAVPVNISCLGGNRLKVYSTSLVLNTAAYRVGVGFAVSDMGLDGPQLWWDATGRTSSGATAARVAGSDISLVAAKRVKKVYQRFYVGGATTADESFIGYAEFVSNAFDTALPLTFPFQPSGTGRAATMTPMIFADYELNTDIGIKAGLGVATVNTFCNVEEANTTAQSFCSGVAYTR